MLKKSLISLILVTLLLILGTAAVHAYQIDPSYRPSNEPFALNKEIKEGGASGATNIVLQLIAGALLYFAVPIGVIAIVFSGSSMVMNGAEQEKLDAAKKHLTWSVIGLITIILSYSIVRIIINAILQAASSAN